MGNSTPQPSSMPPSVATERAMTRPTSAGGMSCSPPSWTARAMARDRDKRGSTRRTDMEGLQGEMTWRSSRPAGRSLAAAGYDTEGEKHHNDRSDEESDAMSRPSLPTEIGPYRITEYKGEGPLGHTVFAEHSGGDYRVVVRLLPIEAGREGEVGSQAFVEAAQVVTALSHTGLADVLEVARAGDFVCVIEEVVPGQTLAELIRERGALDPGQARQVVAQTLLAVDFSHQRHFAHGTVKPSNIFLMDRYLSVKVVDAGLPELLRHVAPARYARLINSPYVAPEVKEGRPASPASDIYALGVTFYEMYAGSLPEALRTQGRGSDVGGRFDLLEFEAEPAAPTAPEPAEVPSLGDLVSLPPAQVRTIEQAMSKSPGHRPPTIRSIRVAFGFAKPTSAHAQGAAAGYLGAAAVGGAREVEYELTPAQGGGDPCPACQRPLRPGAPSCLACGYVLPSQGDFDLPDLPAAGSSAGTADFLE
ncbi:MAG: protein kinase, partial [Armatimonadia bacterium]|nr:protein kinase [Armatimonadia bacterium]